MNEALGETDEEGEVTPATFANAEAAETALTKDVATAETARDKELAKTVGEQSGALQKGLAKSLGTNNKLTEANLTTALDAVQDEIDNNTVVFSKDVDGNTAADVTFTLYSDGDKGNQVDELLDLGGIDVTESGDITIQLAEFDADANNKSDAAGSGGIDTVILPELAKYTGTLTIENMIVKSTGDSTKKGYDLLVAPDLADLKSVKFTAAEVVDGSVTSKSKYITAELETGAGEGKVIFTNLLKDTTFLNALVRFDLVDAPVVDEDGDATLAGQAVTLNDDGTIKSVEGVLDTILGKFSTELGAAGFAQLLEDYNSLITAEDVGDNLEPVGFTLSDLQDAAADAAEALETARAVESDAALLEGVDAGIGAYLAAGGNSAEILALRTTLETQLEAGDAKIADYTTEKVLKTLLGNSVSVTNGVATVEAAVAPTTIGQGEWVEGDAAEESGKFVFTYTPSAAEQGLLDVVANVDARQELITAEEKTEDALDKAGKALGDTEADSLIAQLDAINGQLDKLADAEQALVDAQDALSDAQPSIDALKAAEAAQAEAEQWFEDNGYELPIELDGTVNATVENDIFLFNPEAEAAIVTDFGKQGEDSIFFGEGFTLVQITETGITGNQGDVNTLEILWQQVGNNVELYVEEVAFAGNGSGTADLTKVTLVGVNGSDLQDNLDNGLLSLGDLIA